MDKNKIRFLLQTINEDICILVNKFLAIDTFNLIDLCYWLNPSKEWWNNKKDAEIILKILKEEDCCIKVTGKGEAAYEKTEAFVDLLKSILKIEKLLKNY